MDKEELVALCVGYEGKRALAVESLVMDWVQYTATKD